MSAVYVVTGLDLGWDCVVAVFKCDDVSEEQIRERFSEIEHVIHGPLEVEKDLGDWED